MRRLALVVVAIGTAVAEVTAAAPTQVHWIMGAYLRVTVDEDAPLAAFDGCFARARALDRTFSRFDPASELVRLNAAGSGVASPDFRGTLGRALALERATEGAFDVSVGALTALWRRPGLPSAAAIATARRTLGAVSVDGDRVTLGPGTQLDFDGLAKGVAVDACVAALRAGGITRALVSFGESSLFGLGAPRGAAAWMLDVRGPAPERAVARLALRDRGAAVSAVFGATGRVGRMRGHIVDPRAGVTVDDDAAAVVVADSATSAEAFAKAVLVRGPRGLAPLERRASVETAWIGRTAIVMGPGMRASGALRPVGHPRPPVPMEGRP